MSAQTGHPHKAKTRQEATVDKWGQGTGQLVTQNSQ